MIAINSQSNSSSKYSSLLKQFLFYAPLAATSLLVSLTHSLFDAGLARLPSPEVLISAFAVAKSVMNLFQSAVMMVTQTVASLVDGKESYYKVRKFVFNLAAMVTAVSALFAFLGIDRLLLANVMGLQGKMLETTLIILKVFIIFPAAVTVRNFMQGICIKFRVTNLFTIGTITRIIFVGTMVLSIQKLTFIPAGVIAGLMLLIAGSIESLVIYIGAKTTIGNIPKKLELLKKHEINEETSILTNRSILVFFLPLVLTSFIGTLATPIINMGLARSISPEMALSTFSVAWGLGMIAISPLGMFHQISLNFIEEGDEESTKWVKIFGIILAIISSSLVGLIAFTNIGLYILGNMIGTSKEISLLSIDVLRLMVVIPFIAITREFYWGRLMKKRMTQYIGRGKIINVITLTLTILVMVFINPANPAIIGAVGVICAEVAELIFLYSRGKQLEFAGESHKILPSSNM